MGALHSLQRVSESDLHSDLSRREASMMCGIAEHAWYLIRQQHHSLRDGCEQLCVLEHSVELLESAVEHASDSFRLEQLQSQLQYAS
jgi:hypothetical protein